MDSYLLLIDGNDEKGLIYKITGALFDHKLNIVHNSEFVEPSTKHFFMRSEFVGNVEGTTLIDNLRSILPKGFSIRLSKMCKKKIVVFATKEHHCLADLLIRNEYCKFNAQIQCVIANHEDLRTLVERFKIPFHYIPNEGKTREQYEQEMMLLIDPLQPDYLVLAKYMRILSPGFVGHYKNRIINIHHSFLPAFIGKDPYQQAYKRGVKIIGATSHFVTENLDEGPILVQEVINIDHKFSAEDMRRAGEDVEIFTLAKALKYVFEERVFISGNKTIIFT